MFRIPKDTELTTALLLDFISKHKNEVTTRYEPLLKAYTSDAEILHRKAKAPHKPDNRIVVNFPKYIVDTMNGYFIGNPIKTTAEDKEVSQFVEYLEQYNDQDDNNAELSKIMSIYGKGYEMYYADEKNELCITYLNPIESFMIFDDSIIERPLYFVRLYKDYENNEYGSISDSRSVRHFELKGGLHWIGEEKLHYFGGVPATEYVENAERQGIFESVLSMCNAYNKVISEKANDVDYFADAYLKILGAKIEGEDIAFIRDTRVLNLTGEDSEKIIAEFMDRPTNDASQENLLARLERLIFQIAMVANISDENFGASSGIALRYKLQAMSNLEKTKERKFTSGMNRRYMLLFSHPYSKVPADSWVQLHYTFTPNIPANLAEEADTAAKLEGLVSQHTQLKTLSIVDNVESEIEQIEEENAPKEETVIEKLMFGKSEEPEEEPEEDLEDEQ